jgi:23S rRNA pseudouridine2605 synthase
LPSIRLQRFLARCGQGSRRSCEKLISAGAVTINGDVVTEMGARVEEGDVVAVTGKIVKPKELRYYIVNKPKGWISVDQDMRGRRYIVEIVPGGREMGLFPIGRLDLDTTGFMILTNDGDLANRIAHPRYEVEKEYTALVKGRWTRRDLEERFGEGIMLNDGAFVGNVRVTAVKPKGERTSVTLRIHEGRKHIVKRIFLSIDSRVYELHRNAIGKMDLGGLRVGEWREIGPEDINEMILED